jgi:hypothetical protein
MRPENENGIRRLAMVETDADWLKQEFEKLGKRFDKLDERVDNLAIVSAVNKTKLGTVMGGIALFVSMLVNAIARMFP